MIIAVLVPSLLYLVMVTWFLTNRPVRRSHLRVVEDCNQATHEELPPAA